MAGSHLTSRIFDFGLMNKNIKFLTKASKLTKKLVFQVYSGVPGGSGAPPDRGCSNGYITMPITDSFKGYSLVRHGHKVG